MSGLTWRSTIAAAAAGLILAPALSGCASSGVMDALFNQKPASKIESPAHMQNSELAESSNALLDQLWEGEWNLPVGGNVRLACESDAGGEAYQFFGSWFSPEEANYSGSRNEAMARVIELRGWLEADGWEYLDNIEFNTDNVGVNAVGVGGSKTSAGIVDMQAIYYFEGDVDYPFPHIVVDIDSDCLPVNM